jgi:phosphoglycerol transferase MdoB-like AlkP superfamily enzyme
MIKLHWPIRRLGPYSCLLGFLLIGVAVLGVSRALLIGWQWERVDSTDSLLSMLLQGARSDLMTLAMFAAPAVVLLPFFLAARRTDWWISIACAWLTFSLTAILFLEFATPPFLSEYDMRPNRLFVEYLAYPREVSAMVWDWEPQAG